MKKPAWKAFATTIGFALVLIAGCGEKEPPTVKQSRVIAADNMQLKKDLDRSNARFENMKDQYEKELEKQRELFKECKKERDQWRVKSRRNVRDQAQSLVDPLMSEITRLREANKKLTAQLEVLKK